MLPCFKTQLKLNEQRVNMYACILAHTSLCMHASLRMHARPPCPPARPPTKFAVPAACWIPQETPPDTRTHADAWNTESKDHHRST